MKWILKQFFPERFQLFPLLDVHNSNNTYTTDLLFFSFFSESDTPVASRKMGRVVEAGEWYKRFHDGRGGSISYHAVSLATIFTCLLALVLHHWWTRKISILPVYFFVCTCKFNDNLWLNIHSLRFIEIEENYKTRHIHTGSLFIRKDIVEW